MLLHSVCFIALLSLVSCMKSETRSTRTNDPSSVQMKQFPGTGGVILVCVDTFSGRIVLNPIWTKDDTRLKENDRIRISRKNVTIHPILLEDEGQYQCNNGEPYQLTIPPQVLDSRQRYVVHERGLPLQLECGLELGPLSRTLGFSVGWQRVYNKTSIIFVSCCSYPEENSTNCADEFNRSDFSLTLTEKTYRDVEGLADYKCIVTQLKSGISASVNTKIILFDSITDVKVVESSDCMAPRLHINIPHPIHLPQTLLSSNTEPIQLSVEYTRVCLSDENSHHSEEDIIDEVIDEVNNASSLLTANTLQLQLRSVPNEWKAYVVRVRLNVLGKGSRFWSSYSHPLCMDCQDCVQVSSVKMDLRLSFSSDSNLCSYEEEVIEDEMVMGLKTAIQQTCPDYLCRDLTFSSIEFSCSSEDKLGLFSAMVAGIGTQKYTQSFLESISQQPLRLTINDTIVEVILFIAPVMTTPSPSPVPKAEANTIAGIAGSSGGAGLAVVILFSALAISYTVWRRKKYLNENRRSYSSTEETESVVAGEPVEPRICPQQLSNTSLSVHHNNQQHSDTQQPSLPHPHSSYPSNSRHFHTTTSKQLSTSQNKRHSPLPNSFLSSPLTMSQAGQLVRNQQDINTDASSIYTSTYTPPSEISFISSTHRTVTPLYYRRSEDRETPVSLRSSPASLRSSHCLRQNMFLPLSQPSPPSTPHRPSTAYHYHSHDPTPLVTQFLSDSPPGSSSSHWSRKPRAKAVSLSHSPPPSLACGSQSPFSEQHYRLWTSRATSPWPRLHLPHRQGVSESPV